MNFFLCASANPPSPTQCKLLDPDPTFWNCDAIAVQELIKACPNGRSLQLTLSDICAFAVEQQVGGSYTKLVKAAGRSADARYAA